MVGQIAPPSGPGRKMEACGAENSEQAALVTSRRERDRSGHSGSRRAAVTATTPAESAPIALADEKLFRASARFYPGNGLVVDPASAVTSRSTKACSKTVVSSRPGALPRMALQQ